MVTNMRSQVFPHHGSIQCRSTGKLKSRVRSGGCHGRKDEDWRKVRLYGYRPRIALHSGAEQESRDNPHPSAIFAKVGELFATLVFVALPYAPERRYRGSSSSMRFSSLSTFRTYMICKENFSFRSWEFL